MSIFPGPGAAKLSPCSMTEFSSLNKDFTLLHHNQGIISFIP